MVAVLAVVLGGGAAGLWWCRPADDALARARRTGVIRIGYAVEAPYAFLTADGKVTGESPEIARVVAAHLGIPRVEWRLVEFADLIDGLEARRFDVIAAGMFITPERRRRVAFSLPTFQAAPGLLVGKGNPLALHTYADVLRGADTRIAVLTGATEEGRLLQLGCPDARLVRVPDAASGREAVRCGHVAALALSAPTVRWMASHADAGATEVAEPFVDSAGAPASPALGAMAFRWDEPDLRRAWNVELARFLGSTEHSRMVAAFGFSKSELPPSVTLPAAVSGP